MAALEQTRSESTGKPITVVTGGSEGIGLELARRFARAGHAIALVARSPEPLARAAGELRTSGATVIALTVDVTGPGAPATIVDALAGQGYVVDVLINNAGIGLATDFAEQPVEAIEQQLSTNIVALTRLMRHVLPAMLIRGRGGILNIASVGGFMPGPYQSIYYASKAYVLSLSEAVAWEITGSGVHLSVLAPGPVETRFHARMGSETAFYRRLMPSMSPARVADAAYRGFRLRRRVIVPGLLWPAMVIASRLVPHLLLVPFMGWLLWPGRQEPGRAEGKNARGGGGR